MLERLKTSAPQILTIRNVGLAGASKLVISTVSNGLKIDPPPCSWLDAGATCDISLRFEPDRIGSFLAVLNVRAVQDAGFDLPVTAYGAWKVSVESDGGNIASNDDAGIQCPPRCDGLYAQDAYVRLQATPTNGSKTKFQSWSGCPQTPLLDGGSNCLFTVGLDQVITANFEPFTNNLAFVTAQTFRGVFDGGEVGADYECNKAATAAGINPGGRSFVAWLSTTSSSAAQRLSPDAGGWVRLDGKPFAISLEDLRSGKVLNPLNVTERGDRVPVTVTSTTEQKPVGSGIYRIIFTKAWTGTTADGGPNAPRCQDWTMTGGNNAIVGRLAGGPGLWTAEYQEGCGRDDYHLYCLQKTVSPKVVLLPLPAGGRLAFYAYGDGGFRPTDGGIVAADKFCNDNQPALQPPGTRLYLAFLSTYDEAARERISPLMAGYNYHRPDGVFVGTGKDIGDGNLESGIWMREDRTYLSNEAAGAVVAAWTGFTATSKKSNPPEDSCDSWTRTDAGKGFVGNINSAYNSVAWAVYDDLKANCFEPHPIICLEKNP